MTDVALYGFPQSSYVRSARMALHEKGVPYDLEPADLHSEGYLSTHPFDKVPAFRHGDFRLFETMAIAHYVDRTFDGPALAPADPQNFARMTQWNSAIVSYLYPAMIGGVVLERVAPVLFDRPTDEAKVAEALPKVEYQLGVIDKAFEHDWLAGNMFSIADLMLAPIVFYLNLFPDTGGMIAARANIGAWYERVSARESFAETVPELSSG